MFRSRSLLKQVFNDVDKVSTRVYGLPAVKNSRQVLRGLLKKHIATARELDNGRNIAYNMSEMKNCAWRLHICDTAETVREIEETIGMGQIEELIEAHEESIHLLTLMNLEVQPWAEETNWEFEKDVARNQKYIGFDDDKLRLHPGHATEHAMYGHAYSHSFGDNAVLPVQEGEVDEADMVPLEDFFPAHIREEFDNENLAYESELAKRGPLKSKK